jgi:spermidine/putrescine transport system permease protein
MTARRAPFAVSLTAVLTYAFMHLPLLVLIAFSFNRSRFGVQWGGFTLDWYARLASRPDILRALRLSLVVGLLSTLLATALGTLASLALARHLPRARRSAGALLYLPIVTPEIIAGVSLLVLFSWLGIALGITTIVIAHTAFSIPFVTVVLLARLQGSDRSLEEAAMSLGADEFATFRRVTLPQLMPGVLAGALLAFTLSFDDFVITFFVAGVGSTTLPLAVYSMVRKSVEPTINALSALLVIGTTVAVYLADRLARGSARA